MVHHEALDVEHDLEMTLKIYICKKETELKEVADMVFCLWFLRTEELVQHICLFVEVGFMLLYIDRVVGSTLTCRTIGEHYCFWNERGFPPVPLQHTDCRS